MGQPDTTAPVTGWFSMFRPLRQRDFALLWSGMTVSLLGDGIYLVAIAWQAYDLSNSPSALSAVGLSWGLGLVAFLLVGGVLSDRLDRRRVLIFADVVRCAVLTVIGVLSITGALELWMLVVLAGLFGAGEAFSGPAFTAIIPDIVAEQDLVGANALEQFIRPVMFRLLGPLVGGAIIALSGVGTAFLVDAATFVVSAGCLLALRVAGHARTPVADGEEDRSPSMLRDLGEGWRFVRANTWLWAMLIGASIAILLFYGPSEVLIPFIVRNELHGSAAAFGAVLAGSGVGAVIGSFAMARIGMPRRPITFTFWVWGLCTAPMVLYAVITATWQPIAIAVVMGLGETMGEVVWTTLMQTRVPAGLRGRVSSLDWFASLGLVPLSFALTGPAASLFGVEATLVVGGALGTVVIIGLLYVVPGLRDEDARLTAPAVGAQTGVGTTGSPSAGGSRPTDA
jgi:MFS family permease